MKILLILWHVLMLALDILAIVEPHAFTVGLAFRICRRTFKLIKLIRTVK